MYNYQKTSLLLLFSLTTSLLAGCQTARKDVVEIGDNNLSCHQLRSEIAEASHGSKDAENKAVAGIAGGGAVAAGAALILAPIILIPVAAIGGVTYGGKKGFESNDMHERKQHLTAIYNNKGCEGRETSINNNSNTNNGVAPSNNTENVTMQAQRALIDKGYAPGVVDGKFGPKTMIALKEYQAKNGLAVTGELDKATEKSLLLSKSFAPLPKEKTNLTAKIYSSSLLVEDAAIESSINKEILADQLFTNTEHTIVTSVLNGVALLTGNISNQKQKFRAGQIAKSHTEIKQVVNQLEFSRKAKMRSRINDSLITKKVKDELFRQGVVDSNNIKVETNRGIVYLLGIVTPQQGEKLIAMVKQTNGVVRIVKVFMLPA